MSSALGGKSGGIQCRIQGRFFHSQGQPTSPMKEEVDGKQILEPGLTASVFLILLITSKNTTPDEEM
jgi:hypothetical protein